jgi:hypothetical protein
MGCVVTAAAASVAGNLAGMLGVVQIGMQCRAFLQHVLARPCACAYQTRPAAGYS